MGWILRLLRSEPGARRFFLAYGQSSIGTGVAYVALLLVAYRRLHSPWAIALVLMADFVPPMLLSPVFGAAADRWSRRRCAILADVVRAVAFIGIATFDNFPATVAFALLAGAGTALFKPAILAGLPSLVHRARLAEATALYGALTEVGYTVGPALAAVFLLVTGPEPLLAANGLTFAISALLLATVRFGTREPASDGPRERSSLLWETRHGIRAVFKIPGVPVVILATSAMMLTAGILNVSELLYVRQLGGGAAGYAAVVTAAGIGIGLGSIAGKGGGSLSRLENRYVLGIALFAAGLLGASASPNLAGVAAAFVVGGVGNGLVLVHQRLIMQRVVDDDMLGRVFGVQGATDGCAFALAFVGTAPLLSVVSPRMLIAIAGAGSLAVAGLALRSLKRAVQPRGAVEPHLSGTAEPTAVAVPESGTALPLGSPDLGR
jgi:MFS family permease